MTDQRAYKTLTVRKGVIVKVPNFKDSVVTRMNDSQHHMNKVPAHSFKLHGKTIHVPEHWHHGQSFSLKFTWPSNVIVNRHFYGINESDLGKRIVAEVKVVRKTTAVGRQFIALDITKAPEGSRPTFRLRYPNNGKGSIPIPGTATKLWFQMLRKPKRN